MERKFKGKLKTVSSFIAISCIMIKHEYVSHYADKQGLYPYTVRMVYSSQDQDKRPEKEEIDDNNCVSHFISNLTKLFTDIHHAKSDLPVGYSTIQPLEFFVCNAKLSDMTIL